MNIFGWTLIRTDDLKDLQKQANTLNRIATHLWWFNGWRDLDIIWEYFFSDNYFGDISSCREKYAKARCTTIYGETPKCPDVYKVDDEYKWSLQNVADGFDVGYRAAIKDAIKMIAPSDDHAFKHYNPEFEYNVIVDQLNSLLVKKP